MKTAYATIKGFEVMRMFRKGQFRLWIEAVGGGTEASFVNRLTVRFSNSTGIPNVPDGSRSAIPHGMTLKFHLPNGSDTDMVLNAFKFFPVSTGADFRDMLLALAASPADGPKPTKFDEFVASHPALSHSRGAILELIGIRDNGRPRLPLSPRYWMYDRGEVCAWRRWLSLDGDTEYTS